MHPSPSSITLLSTHAQSLGRHCIGREWDFIQNEFENYWDGHPYLVSTFEDFTVWVKNYAYYDCLVCIKLGNSGDIEAALKSDYDTLLALVGSDIVVDDECTQKAKSSVKFIASRAMDENWEGLVQEFFNYEDGGDIDNFAEWLEDFLYMNAIRAYCMGDKDKEKSMVEETYHKLCRECVVRK